MTEKDEDKSRYDQIFQCDWSLGIQAIGQGIGEEPVIPEGAVVHSDGKHWGIKVKDVLKIKHVFCPYCGRELNAEVSKIYNGFNMDPIEHRARMFFKCDVCNMNMETDFLCWGDYDH